MNVIAVAVGGLIGTALRLGLDAALPHDANGFPLSTFLINVVGSFILGLLVARLWPRVPSWAQAGLGPGLLGSFTTFSAVMVSLVTLTVDGQAMLAIGYLSASVVVGLAAAALGLRAGHRADLEPTIEVNE